MRWSVFATVTAVAAAWLSSPQIAVAQPLSYWLGAYKLDGLRTYKNCMDASYGFRETLIADRIEQRLAISTALKPDERAVWQADIDALRAVPRNHAAFRGPDRERPQHYLDGMTADEFRAIQSMATRFQQEVQLSCEQKYGDIARKRDGETTASQAQFEANLRAKFVEPTDVKTLSLTALTSPFPEPEGPSAEEQIAVARAAAQSRQAAAQGGANRVADCTAGMGALRWQLMADKMEQGLNAATGLTAQKRADWQADIAATRRAATQRLPMVEAIDPANPYRFMTWLSNDEQMAIGTQFATQAATYMATCTKN
jgi:hypothetical protein